LNVGREDCTRKKGNEIRGGNCPSKNERCAERVLVGRRGRRGGGEPRRTRKKGARNQWKGIHLGGKEGGGGTQERGKSIQEIRTTKKKKREDKAK